MLTSVECYTNADGKLCLYFNVHILPQKLNYFLLLNVEKLYPQLKTDHWNN